MTNKTSSDERVARWAASLPDARGRRVVFVSHCLLNQNVRYLGGAWCPGTVPELLDAYARTGVGLVQMPCPEQACWGGVTKRFIVRFYGCEGSWPYRLRGLLLPLFIAYTRWVYARLAARMARQAVDWARSGVEIVGIVGVGDSPSCGVHHRLDLRRSWPVVAALRPSSTDTRTFNEQAVRDCIVAGEGLFMASLRRQLERRRLAVRFLEHTPPSVRSGTGD